MSCAQECCNQGSSASTRALGTDLDQCGSVQAGNYQSVRRGSEFALRHSQDLAITRTSDLASLPTHASSSLKSGLNSSRIFDSHSCFSSSYLHSHPSSFSSSLVSDSVFHSGCTLRCDFYTSSLARSSLAWNILAGFLARSSRP